MENDLYTLAYFSRNAVVEVGSDLETEIGKILAAARRNNPQNGVTGALLYSGGCFAQVLEGPLQSVEKIFESIECDPRHNDVTILHFKPVEARTFGRWSMAFAGIANATAAAPMVEGVLADPEAIASGQAGSDLVAVLSGLIGRHEAARTGSEQAA